MIFFCHCQLRKFKSRSEVLKTSKNEISISLVVDKSLIKLQLPQPQPQLFYNTFDTSSPSTILFPRYTLHIICLSFLALADYSTASAQPTSSTTATASIHEQIFPYSTTLYRFHTSYFLLILASYWCGTSSSAAIDFIDETIRQRFASTVLSLLTSSVLPSSIHFVHT